MRAVKSLAWATGVVVVAACGGGGDVTAPPSDAELACVNPTDAGAAVTCSLTLSKEAGFKATLVSHETCEAHGDTFVITAPVSATLTTDGCYETAGKEVDLGGNYPSGTKITFEFTPGPLATGSPGVAAVKVEGAYPQWTLSFEDALGSFPGVAEEYKDVTVTVTVVPTGA